MDGTLWETEEHLRPTFHGKPRTRDTGFGEEKYCTACCAWWPVTCFGKDKQRPDGRRNCCFACRAEKRVGERGRSNKRKSFRLREGASGTEKFCSGCHHWLLLSLYCPDPKAAGGVYSRCRKCKNKRDYRKGYNRRSRVKKPASPAPAAESHTPA